jgi:hypothetical protein
MQRNKRRRSIEKMKEGRCKERKKENKNAKKRAEGQGSSED